MRTIGVEVDPAEAGFDPHRLARLDRHLARYVDDGWLAGWQLLVARRGAVLHHSTCGQRDREAGLPVKPDTIWRVYSMTKPVTSVAAMMLYEDGLLQLRDPVSRYIPSFAGCRVYVRGPSTGPVTVPVTEPVRIWHLLTHTSGLTYGFHRAHLVDALYREAGYEFFPPHGVDLAAACDAWAALPLLFQPGTEWNYGVSTDVLGRVVEVVSGMPLDRFFAERILGPVGMVDTAFSVSEEQAHRLARLYAASAPGRPPTRQDAYPPDLRDPTFLSGGGGLVSTAADYHRLTRLLLGGGELDGVRLLSSRTVDFMTRNHLPGGRDLAELGRPFSAEPAFEGIGFGLGFSVVLDPVRNESLASAGEFFWGGLASTLFWVDPVERVTVVFLTQLIPSSTYPIRFELRQLVNSSLVD
ncbi:MAG TPA: serine hydrolase domain-containing protein [Mycobacteriales bacterium]|nr:serine hydrolase domain-containing protein [Mycobacteriales bacterium]